MADQFLCCRCGQYFEADHCYTTAPGWFLCHDCYVRQSIEQGIATYQRPAPRRRTRRSGTPLLLFGLFLGLLFGLIVMVIDRLDRS